MLLLVMKCNPADFVLRIMANPITGGHYDGRCQIRYGFQFLDKIAVLIFFPSLTEIIWPDLLYPPVSTLADVESMNENKKKKHM